MSRPFSPASSAVAITLFFRPATGYAQNFQIIPGSWDSGRCDITTGKLDTACIPMMVGHLVGVVFSLISAFFLLNVLYAGYEIALGYIRGEKAEGIERLRWSIIGLVVSVCAFLILNFVVTIITP